MTSSQCSNPAVSILCWRSLRFWLIWLATLIWSRYSSCCFFRAPTPMSTSPLHSALVDSVSPGSTSDPPDLVYQERSECTFTALSNILPCIYICAVQHNAVLSITYYSTYVQICHGWAYYLNIGTLCKLTGCNIPLNSSSWESRYIHTSL